jgi:hypothetical protein
MRLLIQASIGRFERVLRKQRNVKGRKKQLLGALQSATIPSTSESMYIF